MGCSNNVAIIISSKTYRQKHLVAFKCDSHGNRIETPCCCCVRDPPKMMKDAYLFHNHFLCSGFSQIALYSGTVTPWYSVLVNGRLMLNCWNIRPHTLWYSHQRSLSTSQPAPFQTHSLPLAVIFPFFVVSLLKNERAEPGLLNAICQHWNLFSVLPFIPSWGDLSSFKGYPVSLWSDDMDLIPRLKILWKWFFFSFSNVHAGQLECDWKSMLSVCQDEWNWELNTGIQTVNQRVLACKLCIISNWVASALLLKSVTFPFSLFQAVFCESCQKVSCKPLERFSRGLQANSAWWLLQSNECYNSLETVFVYHPIVHWGKLQKQV